MLLTFVDKHRLYNQLPYDHGHDNPKLKVHP